MQHFDKVSAPAFAAVAGFSTGLVDEASAIDKPETLVVRDDDHPSRTPQFPIWEIHSPQQLHRGVIRVLKNLKWYGIKFVFLLSYFPF